MIKPKYKQIIEGLKKATESGKIKWNMTALERKYETSIKNYKISIYQIKDDGAFIMLLPGTVCAEMNFMEVDGEIFDKIVIYDTKSEDYRMLAGLFDVVRRSVTGSDKKLDEILSFL